MPRDAVSRTANVERTGRHKWVNIGLPILSISIHWIMCGGQRYVNMPDAIMRIYGVPKHEMQSVSISPFDM